MLKKLICTGTLLAASITTAHAAFYAGPSLGMIDNTSPNGSYRGLQPRIDIGYNEMASPCTYLAVEGYASAGSIMLSDNTPVGLTLKSSYTFGASFIPGYMITDNVVGYLRGGIVETKFIGPNDSQTGGEVGIGMQTSLTPYWHVRTEYDYIAYTQATGIGAVKTDQFILGLIYNFI